MLNFKFMKVGSKVVCINDNFHPESKKIIPNLPKLHEKYIIRDIFPTRKGIEAVLLKELRNPKVPVGEGENGYMFESCFNSNRFVEVEDFNISESIYEDDFMYA